MIFLSGINDEQGTNADVWKLILQVLGSWHVHFCYIAAKTRLLYPSRWPFLSFKMVFVLNGGASLITSTGLREATCHHRQIIFITNDEMSLFLLCRLLNDVLFV